MGTVYRRKVRFCTTCNRRLDTTEAWRGCTAAEHVIETREQQVWWIRYSIDGQTQYESSRSPDRQVAEDLLTTREGRVAVARVTASPPAESPAVAAPAPVLFDDAADELILDYTVNKKRSIGTLKARINLHLRPVFGGQPLASITTSAVRAYSVARLSEGVTNATVNRELMTLKRMFTMGVQAEQLSKRPFIPLLKEQNIRRGFFEPAQFERILAHLPAFARGIAAFAYITGWRTPSEILPLEWRQVDMNAGEVRLDPGATKNGDGRVFPFTAALRRVFETQQLIASDLQTTRGVATTYVFCQVRGTLAGRRVSESGYSHMWHRARRLAGCPTHIPHDFRRTAVRNLVRAGVPERVAMLLSGHRTRSVFERYNIVSPGDLHDAARRLDQFTPCVATTAG